MGRRLSRRALAHYVADGVASKSSAKKTVQQLAAYLVESRRTKELDLIVRDVATILAEKGIMTGTLTTAYELSREAKKAIETSVAKETGATHISLAEEIDASLVGGYKVALPGHEIDRSIAHQLTTLKTRLKKV